VIPGSHRISDVRDLVGRQFEAEGLVDVEVDAGDILIHDALLVHGSEASAAGQPIRRTLYFVVQEADWATKEGYVAGVPTPRGWIAEQFKLMQEAIRLRAGEYSDEPDVDYAIPERWRSEVEATPVRTRPYPDFLDDDYAQKYRDEFSSYFPAAPASA
jgi:ectoine hydroxylase-related dioxygenase (phytanoyl-CoA dioxygenase family)